MSKEQKTKKLTDLTNVKNSTILYLFTSAWTIPNGDPYTKSQRYDEVTGRILISDVRIKRYIRDYLLFLDLLQGKNSHIYVCDKYSSDGEGSASWARVQELAKEIGVNIPKDLHELILQCIDVRMLGGITTCDLKKHKGYTNAKVTGPIQFNLLNPSLNRVQLRFNENTSVFKSKVENESGAMGGTNIVPFAINQITGSVTPSLAIKTGLTEEEVLICMKSVWKAFSVCKSRSKMGQTSRFLLKINMDQPDDMPITDVEQLIKIKDPENTELRKIDDVTWDFSDLVSKISDSNVKNVEYYADSAVKNPLLKAFEKVSNKLVELK